MLYTLIFTFWVNAGIASIQVPGFQSLELCEVGAASHKADLKKDFKLSGSSVTSTCVQTQQAK
jgi:hypothetical protein